MLKWVEKSPKNLNVFFDGLLFIWEKSKVWSLKKCKICTTFLWHFNSMHVHFCTHPYPTHFSMFFGLLSSFPLSQFLYRTIEAGIEMENNGLHAYSYIFIFFSHSCPLTLLSFFPSLSLSHPPTYFSDLSFFLFLSPSIQNTHFSLIIKHNK
jgi:hypothetical protein